MFAKSKDIAEVLHEEFFRERAATLAKAGESLHLAINKMEALNEDIRLLLAGLEAVAKPAASGMLPNNPNGKMLAQAARQAAIAVVNEVIDCYNSAREYALLRHYYLIVTREAVGLRCHKTVEEFFRIGPKRDHIR